MAAHAAQGVDIGSAILYLDSFYGVRIIRRPSLGRIIEYPRVEPRPAACAGLKQNIREFLSQPFIQAIDPQDILMTRLSLPASIFAVRKSMLTT